jgi:hypothetical protein
MQKTLALLVIRMEGFAEQHPGPVADLLGHCL